MSAHAVLSPSGAAAWMACPGKLAMEKGLPDTPNDYSDEGTAAHLLAAYCLESSRPAIESRGERMDLGHRTVEVTEDMAKHVQVYVDQIESRIEGFKLAGAKAVDLLIEVRLDFSVFVGQPDSFGTADALLLIEWPNGKYQIDVNDLKFGRGVRVGAEGNEQLLCYALGAYDQFAAMGEVEAISMAIHQPRLDNYDEWQITVEELLAFGVKLGDAADKAMAMYNGDDPLELFPGEDQCRFCKARATCPALREHVMQSALADFVDIEAPSPDQAKQIPQKLQLSETEQLDALFPSLELVEIWTRALRAEIERRALAGVGFTTCKVVQGKKGNRAWADPKEAEAVMKSMRLRQDEMYETKLISPTAAEKVLKESQKRWTRLLPLITQAPGPLSIAPVSDRRPAVVISISPVTEAFDSVPEEEMA